MYAQNVHSRIAIQDMSVVHHPFACENCYILYLGLRKHFRKNMYAKAPTSALQIYKMFRKQTTLMRDIVHT